ncbi:MAG: hypothetical protein M0R35_07095 [Candidatus Omnitrophica bacterium]|jgi:hypothetical protein|nr:hypothetical protein [Candidatus Omnitrophota bacterium]
MIDEIAKDVQVNSGEVLTAAEIEFNPIDEAKKILEETKKTLGQITDERKRIEKATAEMLVNGRSYAGQNQTKPETADEKWAREAEERYAGTGMSPVSKKK